MKVYWNVLTRRRDSGIYQLIVLTLISAFLFLIVFIPYPLPKSLQRAETEITFPDDASYFKPPVMLLLKKMAALYPKTSINKNEGTVSALLRHRTIYACHMQTGYQQVFTDNSLIRKMVSYQLDDHGIEYQVSEWKWNGSVKKGWIISWGSILYLPQINF